MDKNLEIFESNVRYDPMYRSLLKTISKSLNLSEKSIHGYNFNSLKSDSKNRLFKEYILSVIIIIVVPFILFLMLFKRNKKNTKSDISFEEWRDDSYSDYYKHIIDSLNCKYKITRFLSAKSAFNTVSSYQIIKYTEYVNKNIVFQILKFLLQNFRIIFLLHKLKVKYNINFLFLYIKFIFAYIKFHSNAKYINTKVLISALDFNSHLLKHEIFSKYNIKYLCIQSSIRTKEFFDYKSADIIFCQGKHQSNIYKVATSTFKDIITIGSIKSAPYNVKLKKEFDILFAEQYYDFDTLSYASNQSYIKILTNLIEFSKEYPQYKIIYRTREEKRLKKPNLEIYETILKQLEDSNIIIDSKGNSYEKVLKSKMVVGYFSTLCFEAIGLNIPTLFCYYDDYKFDLFDLNNSEEDILVKDSSYSAFKKSILHKLKEEDSIDYFSKYKRIYMDQNSNTINTICNKIEDIINDKS